MQLQTAILAVTNQCNLECFFCSSDSQSRAYPGELTVCEWCSLIDEMANLGVKKILYSGGEPTLKPGIGDIIDYTAGLGIDWGMISNGFHIPDNLLRLFQERKPTDIILSVDGLREAHNILRKNASSFQRVDGNLKELQKREIPCSIITTVHKLNWRELFCIAGFIKENKICAWQIQLAMPFGRMKHRADLLLSQEELLQTRSTVERIKEALPEVKMNCFNGACSGCGAGLESVSVDSLGNVRGGFSGDECPPEGNIRKRSFSEIWREKNLFYYRRSAR